MVTVMKGGTASSGARAVAALCALTLAIPLGAAAAQAPDAEPLKHLNASVSSLIQRTAPSVVQITVSGYGPIEGGANGDASVVIGRQRALGSGVIVDPGGYIVTNAHVLAGAQRVQVTLASPSSGDSPVRSLVSGRGRILDATVVGVAPEVDLAVLKVDATGLPALPLADYDALHQGELVFAFGSPEGLRNSVTMGVVSAAARQPDMDSPMVYIQTDAPINPGNSGGPLVNVNGEVVGINTFIYTESGGSQGLGFAIPSAIVSVAWPQLRQFGHLHRGRHRHRSPVDHAELASGLGLPRDYGVVIADVRPGTAAAAAGLRVQDVIESLDGKPVRQLLRDVLPVLRPRGGRAAPPGCASRRRDFSTEVVVGPAADRLDRLADDLDPVKNLVRRLGVLGASVDSRVSALMPDLRVPFGVVVLGRASRSRGTDTPLEAGDVIHAVNGSSIATFDDLDTAMNALAPRTAVALQIERDGRLMFVTLTVE